MLGVAQPLAAIPFQSEIASKHIGKSSYSNAQLLEALSEVTEQSHRAAGIIRGVRSLVRKSEPQRSLVQLNDLVREMARLGLTVNLRALPHSSHRFERG
jgi:C4-dicarboxylate-specific signal transduction histidine kinase